MITIALFLFLYPAPKIEVMPNGTVVVELKTGDLWVVEEYIKEPHEFSGPNFKPYYWLIPQPFKPRGCFKFPTKTEFDNFYRPIR